MLENTDKRLINCYIQARDTVNNTREMDVPVATIDIDVLECIVKFIGEWLGDIKGK